MRKLLAVLFVAILGLSACGGGGTDQASEAPPTTQLSGRDIVLASVGKTETQTAKVDLNYVIEGAQGQAAPTTFTGNGLFDMQSGNGQLNLKLPIQGTELNMEARSVDKVLYLKYAGPNGQTMTEKPWLKASLEELGKMSGSSGFGQGTNNPADGLRIFQTAGADVSEVGKEPVRGAEATHYKVVLNPAELAKDPDPIVRDQAAQLQAVFGNNPLPADIWIDDQGRVVKYSMTIDMASVNAPAGGQKPTGTVRVSMEMYDFGTPVNVTAPPADQTANFSEAMASMGAAAGAA